MWPRSRSGPPPGAPSPGSPNSPNSRAEHAAPNLSLGHLHCSDMSLDLKGPAGLSEPLAGKAQLIDYFRGAEKPRAEWTIGVEHAKIGILDGTYQTVPYYGEDCTRARRHAQVARAPGTARIGHDAHDGHRPGESRLEQRTRPGREGARRQLRISHRLGPVRQQLGDWRPRRRLPRLPVPGLARVRPRSLRAARADVPRHLGLRGLRRLGAGRSDA